MKIAFTGGTGLVGRNAKAVLAVAMKWRSLPAASLCCCNRRDAKQRRRIHRTFFELP